MAVSQNLTKRTLQLKIKTGVDANNKDVFKTLSFGNVKVAATVDSIYSTASAIAKVLSVPVSEILIAESSDLLNA